MNETKSGGMTVSKMVLAIVVAAIILFFGSAILAGIYDAATRKPVDPDVAERVCLDRMAGHYTPPADGTTLEEFCRGVHDMAVNEQAGN